MVKLEKCLMSSTLFSYPSVLTFPVHPALGTFPLFQKIKYKYDFITDVITLECQVKIGADWKKLDRKTSNLFISQHIDVKCGGNTD